MTRACIDFELKFLLVVTRKPIQGACPLSRRVESTQEWRASPKSAQMGLLRRARPTSDRLVMRWTISTYASVIEAHSWPHGSLHMFRFGFRGNDAVRFRLSVFGISRFRGMWDQPDPRLEAACQEWSRHNSMGRKLVSFLFNAASACLLI